MSINGSIPFWMADVQGVSVSIRAHGDSTDVSICDGKNLQATAALRLNINASMEVVSAQFGESTAQNQRNI